MTVLYYLIPVTLALGLAGLAVFFWSLRSGQYDDLAGAAERILLDEDDRPPKPAPTAGRDERIAEASR
jgi:cbb3-type cytochrome oxidase maturation protein